MQLISLTVKTRRGVAVNQIELIDIDDIAGPIIEANGGADSSFMLREGKKGPFPYSPTNTFVTEYVVDETIAAILLLASNTFAVNILTARGRAVTGSPLMAFSVPFVSGVIKPLNTGSEFAYQEDSDPSLVAYTVVQDPANILAQIQASGGGGGGINPVLNYLDPAISYINTPPVTPTLGDRHLINTAPTGVWALHANEVAEWDGIAWTYYVPVADDYIYVTNTLSTYRFTGTTWQIFQGTALLQNGNTLGASGVRMGTNDANPVWIKYNNTLRVRIDGSDIRTPGSLYLGIVNMATAPSARLHVVSTTEQLRVGYDASNYFKAVVNLSGAVTLDAIGVGATFILSQNGTKIFHLNPNGTVRNTFVGEAAGNSSLTGNENVGIGTNALSGLTSGTDNLGIGFVAGSAITSGGQNIIFGPYGGGSLITGSGNIMLGYNTSVSSGSVSSSIVLGSSGTARADNQLVVGNHGFHVMSSFFGKGVCVDNGASALTSFSFSVTGINGSNNVGAVPVTDGSAANGIMYLDGSRGTGTGAGGDIVFRVAPSGLTGNAQNSLIEAGRIRQDAYTCTRKLLIDFNGSYSGGGAAANGAKFIIVNNNAATIETYDGQAMIIKPANAVNNTFTGIDFRSHNDSLGSIFGVEHISSIFNDFVWWGYTGAAAIEKMRLTNLGTLALGTASPNANALLEVSSTTQGVLFPRMTTAQKAAIVGPAGLVVYDTTLNKFCVYTTAWQTITSV